MAASGLKGQITVSNDPKPLNEEDEFFAKPEIRGGNRPADYIPSHGDVDIVVEDADPEGEDE